MITKRLSVEDLLKSAAEELNKACESASWERHVKRAEPMLVALLAMIRAQEDGSGIYEEVRVCTVKT